MEDKLITAALVRRICGGISDMALWRYLKRPELNFPRPRYIGARRYWVEAEVLAWLRSLPVNNLASAE